MELSIPILFLALLLFMIPSSSSSSSPSPPSSCLNQRCGTQGLINVKYPFALANQSGCTAFSPFFLLNCDARTSKMFINITTWSWAYSSWIQSPVEVTHINQGSLLIDVTSLRSILTVHNRTSCNSTALTSYIYLPSSGPFVISNDNELGSFGCTYSGYVAGTYVTASAPAAAPAPAPSSWNFDEYFGITDNQVGGCIVSCEDTPACGNQQCCASNISTSYKLGFRFVYFWVYDQSYFLPANTPCTATRDGGYSILFHRNSTDFVRESYQLKLSWALPLDHMGDNIDAIKKSSHYACSPNSIINLVEEVPGYLCSCGPGYTGDGYLNGSRCHDVNECIDTLSNECVPGSRCRNVEGNYTCSCSGWFYVGDGRRNGSGCHFSHRKKIAIAVSSAIVGFLLIIGSFAHLAIWWTRRTRRKYFMQNDGLEVQAFLGARPGREMTRLFKVEELKAATNNYAENMKLGAGGFGTVFKGTLDNGKVVAIKRAENMGSKDEAHSRQFLNEMAILTQINHRHIVRLLGCCLETKVPLLVYEYVSNGNVAEALQAKRGTPVFLGWEQRLKVARQTAEALAYLHAAASPPILHRDVKSANVLLDDNLDAKVADFGLSRLVPDGVEQLSTAIQGTIGYLDPEYFQTLQLTDKSDVYGLGVMLIELITGLKPVDNRNRETRFANLALLFIHQMQEGKLEELIDPRLSQTSSDAILRTHSSIIAVATLASECLALKGSMRPSMSEVAESLRHISQSLHARANEDGDEAAPLLFPRMEAVEYDVELCAEVLKKSQYDSLHSRSIDNMVLNTITLAR